MVEFFDTCVSLGRARAPDPPGGFHGVSGLEAMMRRHHITRAAAGHAVAMEASPGLGHEMLQKELAGKKNLLPAWHLMPHVSSRIERAVTDPAEFLLNHVALGRVDALDFCQGKGDQACFAPVLEACQAAGLPVFLDFRRQGDVPAFDFGICGRWPGIPFVIEGFGGYPLHRVVWCLRNYPNCYLSTVGFSVYRSVELICELAGARKIIFGSNWPASPPGMAQGLVLFADIGAAARRQIASRNFERLLPRKDFSL